MNSTPLDSEFFENHKSFLNELYFPHQEHKFWSKKPLGFGNKSLIFPLLIGLSVSLANKLLVNTPNKIDNTIIKYLKNLLNKNALDFFFKEFVGNDPKGELFFSLSSFALIVK